MKRILLSMAMLFGLSQVQTAFAQNQVRLTFMRGGTAVSSVVVSVTDENGNAIENVEAQLVKLTQGTGTDASASATDVALKANGNLGSETKILCADYANQTQTFAEFTFKITGLGSDFSFNHADLQLSAVNGDGRFQNDTPGSGDVRVWSDQNKTQLVVSKDGVQIDKNASTYDTDNTIDWEFASSTPTTASSEQYIVVRVAKSADNRGCFYGLKQVTLYNGYRIATAATANIGHVSTFSAGSSVTFGPNVTAYIAVNSTGQQVVLSPMQGALPANGGAIVSTTDATDIYAFISTDATDSRTNLLEGSGENEKVLTAGQYYIFNKNSENNAVFSILGSSNTTLPAHKAALKKTSTTDDYSMLSLAFGNTTGIGDATVDVPVNGLTYDLSGRVVTASKLPAGLYIKNGKKFVVK